MLDLERWAIRELAIVTASHFGPTDGLSLPAGQQIVAQFQRKVKPWCLSTLPAACRHGAAVSPAERHDLYAEQQEGRCLGLPGPPNS